MMLSKIFLIFIFATYCLFITEYNMNSVMNNEYSWPYIQIHIISFFTKNKFIIQQIMIN